MRCAGVCDSCARCTADSERHREGVIVVAAQKVHNVDEWSKRTNSVQEEQSGSGPGFAGEEEEFDRLVLDQLGSGKGGFRWVDRACHHWRARWENRVPLPGDGRYTYSRKSRLDVGARVRGQAQSSACGISVAQSPLPISWPSPLHHHCVEFAIDDKGRGRRTTNDEGLSA